MAYVGVAKIIVSTRKDDGTHENPFECGKPIQIDIDPQYAEGTLMAGDEEAEYDKEFRSAGITLNTSTLPVEAHEKMFGHTVKESGGVTFKASDEAKYVGVGFRVAEKVDGKRKYVATFLPKVKFGEGAESYKTKGENIEYQTPTIAGKALPDKDGTWKETEPFETEQEAIEWLEEKGGKQEVVEGASEVQVQEDVTEPEAQEQTETNQ